MSTTSNDSPGDEAVFPNEGRLLGLDYGTKRLGISISTPDQSIASPVDNYTRRSEALDARRLRELVEEFRPVGVVVGLPLHTGGEEGQKAHEARTFGKWVGETLGLPVTYWDERFTSARAEEQLIAVDMTRKKRKQRLDKMAAQFILQAYLDRPRPQEETGHESEH